MKSTFLPRSVRPRVKASNMAGDEVVGIVKDNHLIITQKHSQLYTVSTINHYGHIGNKTEIHIGL